MSDHKLKFIVRCQTTNKFISNQILVVKYVMNLTSDSL